MAATIDDVIFCVHGGIPRPLQGEQAASINAIDLIPSPFELTPTPSPQDNPELKQLVTDLLWSDPAQNRQEAFLDQNGFGMGERGPGAVCYGQKAVEEFTVDPERLSDALIAELSRTLRPTVPAIRSLMDIRRILYHIEDEARERKLNEILSLTADDIMAARDRLRWRRKSFRNWATI